MISPPSSPPREGSESALHGNPGPRASDGGIAVVGIGVSVFGLHACSELLADLPEDLGLAIVLAPAVPADNFEALTAYLGTVTALPVQIVQGEVALRPNTIFILPPTGAYVCAGERLLPAPSARNDSPLGRIDGLFRSLAENCRHRAIGVLLSWTAADGIGGLQAIRHAGGKTFADRLMVERRSGGIEFPAAQVVGVKRLAEELGRIGRALSTPSGRLAAANYEAFAPQEDLLNLLASLPLPVVMTGRDRGLRRFTPQAAELFGLSPADIGNPFPPPSSGLQLGGLVQAIAMAMDSGVAIESVVCSHDDRWFSLSIRPCRSKGRHPGSRGAVIILKDIQPIKEGERTFRTASHPAGRAEDMTMPPYIAAESSPAAMAMPVPR